MPFLNKNHKSFTIKSLSVHKRPGHKLQLPVSFIETLPVFRFSNLENKVILPQDSQQNLGALTSELTFWNNCYELELHFRIYVI